MVPFFFRKMTGFRYIFHGMNPEQTKLPEGLYENRYL